MKSIKKTVLLFLVLIAGQAVVAESLSAVGGTPITYRYNDYEYHEIIIPADSFAILELQKGERSSQIIQSNVGAVTISVIKVEGPSSIEKVYFAKILDDEASSVVITTNKRIYHFHVLVNNEKNAYLAASKINFTYP